jgi:hypothetical protein
VSRTRRCSGPPPRRFFPGFSGRGRRPLNFLVGGGGLAVEEWLFPEVALAILRRARWNPQVACSNPQAACSYVGHTTLNASGKYPWLRVVTLFGMVYLAVGVAFPNPSDPSEMQFLWRLAAWLSCAVAFAIHIGLGHFRLRSSPRGTALHAAVAVALGAFALAAAANIHAITSGTGNQRLLAWALVIWPVMTGVPAFVVALIAAAGLARVRPNDKPSGT